MDLRTALGSRLMVDAWAEVPLGREPEEFRLYLINLGNTVEEFNPDIGPRGAFKIGEFTPQED